MAIKFASYEFLVSVNDLPVELVEIIYDYSIPCIVPTDEAPKGIPIPPVIDLHEDDCGIITGTVTFEGVCVAHAGIECYVEFDDGIYVDGKEFYHTDFRPMIDDPNAIVIYTNGGISIGGEKYMQIV